MAGGDSSNTRSLEYTPTWAVATVCFMFVMVSLIGERSLHHLGNWLSRTKRKPLQAALEKMKEELMLLGFISLIITVTATYISKICIKSSFYDKQRMPCKLPHRGDKVQRILSEFPRRILSSTGHTCPKDHEPFVSFLGLEQLHRFIFVMAVTHVIYSCLTMLLAIMKVYSWRAWEQAAYAHADNQENLAELTRNLTLKRQSTFVACHVSTPSSRNKLLLWVICFFRQFGLAVTKSDYLALRLGFVDKHNAGPKYDFHLYMIRSMEDEFKDIIGISPLLWIFVLLFMLFNVDGTNLYFWISFLPIVMVLMVGTKLQHILATLALENSGLSGPITGLNLRPRDELFWFNRPRLLVHFIHFILFQVGFELATFFWIWWQFGWHSCYMSQRTFAYVRVFSGFLVQVLCSYSTLPLYAIATQMGSNHKKAIFEKSIGKSSTWNKGINDGALEIQTEKVTEIFCKSDASLLSSAYHSKKSSIGIDLESCSGKRAHDFEAEYPNRQVEPEDHSKQNSIRMHTQTSTTSSYHSKQSSVAMDCGYCSKQSSTRLQDAEGIHNTAALVEALSHCKQNSTGMESQVSTSGSHHKESSLVMDCEYCGSSKRTEDAETLVTNMADTKICDF